MPNRRPIQVGEVFERLTVIGTADPKLKKKDGYKIFRVSCRCACGNEVVVYESKLRHGTTRSCGCLQIERSIKNLPKATHGLTRLDRNRSRTYTCWVSMKARCTNPKQAGFKHYGGRGISVCERWQKFENFLADMGEAPPELSLDRIDSNGNYEPANCRWANWETQESNRRDNRYVIIDGEKVTTAKASRLLNIDGTTIRARSIRLGISYQEAVNFYTSRKRVA